MLSFKSKKKTIRDLNLSDFLQLKSSGILKSPIILAFAKYKCIFHWLSQEELDWPSDPQGADGDSTPPLRNQGPGSGPSEGWWHTRQLSPGGPGRTQVLLEPSVLCMRENRDSTGEKGTPGRIALCNRRHIVSHEDNSLGSSLSPDVVWWCSPPGPRRVCKRADLRLKTPA